MPTASLQRGKIHLPNECPGYGTKPYNGEASVLELWRMWSTPTLPLLPDPLWPKILWSVRVLSMEQIEPFYHLLYLKPNSVWLQYLKLTACKQMSFGSLKNNIIYTLFTYKSYICIYTHTHTHIDRIWH